MITDSMQSLVAEAAALEPWTLDDDQLRAVLAEAQRARTALDALACRLVAAASDRGLPKDDGATSATAWMSNHTGIGRREASRLVGLARRTGPRTEATRRAWAAGDLSTDKAEVIMRAVAALPDDCDDDESRRAEEHLIELAGRFNVGDLQRLGHHVLEVIDPEGAEQRLGRQLQEEERRAWGATTLTLHRRGDGTTRGTFVIPQAQADALRAAIEGIIAPRRSQTNAERHALDLDDYLALPRSQRMGLAFLELIDHLPGSVLPQAGGLAATVTVNVDLDALRTGDGTATTSSGTTVSAEQARRMSCNAHLVAIYLDGGSRATELGLSKRLFSRHQRLALAARDGGCVWAGCDRPAAWCEAHHLVPWSEDGGTDLDNGALLCHFHHHLVHEGEWTARMAPDGVVEVVPPRRVDPEQRPRRHARFLHQQPRAA